MSKKEEKHDFIPHLKKDKLKAIDETYSAYSSEAFEAVTPVFEKPALKPEPEKKKEDVKSEKEVKSAVVEQAKLDPVKTLPPELKQNIKKIIKETPREKISKLINASKEQKDRLFNKKNCPAFEKLSSKDAESLRKKMEEWKPAKDVCEINASVTISWLNKVENDEV